MNQIDQSDAADNSQNPDNSFNPLTEKEIQESTKAETLKGDETEMGILSTKVLQLALIIRVMIQTN